LKTIVSILSFFVVSSITWGQADTVFVKYNKDKFEDTINYKTDTIIFDTPNARQILHGTTVLPWTQNQQIAKGYGLFLDSVAVTPCSQEQGEKLDWQSEVLSINQVGDVLTMELKFLGNCCHSFLCDVEIVNETEVNLIVSGYGATYCSCTCCFGLNYYFEKMDVEEFDKLKSITINGKESTRKKFPFIESDTEDYTELTRNIIYVGGGRQGLTYLKYERLLLYKDWTQTIANIGLGGIPGDSEEPYNEPRHTIITSEIGQIFGYKNMFVEVGIEPAINIYGDVTYTDLNAILGLRYQSRTKELDGLFFQVGYNPRLYYSYKSDIDVPFYFGLGLNF
jgi:hypothetical protein